MEGKQDHRQQEQLWPSGIGKLSNYNSVFEVNNNNILSWIWYNIIVYYCLDGQIDQLWCIEHVIHHFGFCTIEGQSMGIAYIYNYK